jgi:hydroxymethylglutaryl-CoA lyase
MSVLAPEIQIVECPRDAMQGWKEFIPTEKKIAYLNSLLQVGFDVLDFGSFVSPRAIPQMADTQEVLKHLHIGDSKTALLAIIANVRGAEDALKHDTIQYLGFPFSISETFQMRNTNKTIAQALEDVATIQKMCVANGKDMMLYISMGFGNPYGDAYSADLTIGWFEKIATLGIKNIALADTVGVATPQNIQYIFNHLIPAFPELSIGAHFHATATTRIEKLESAYNAGCRKFDAALLGIGGCPMAKDDLVGNMDTDVLIGWAQQARNIPLQIDHDALHKARQIAAGIFLH